MVSVLDDAMFHTLDVYVHGGGALTFSDVLSVGNRVVKESKHLLRGMA